MSTAAARFPICRVPAFGFAISAFQVVFQHWPLGPHNSDSIYHTLQELHPWSTRELRNPFDNLLAPLGTKSESRIIWHGILIKMPLGSIVPRKTYPAICAPLGRLEERGVHGRAWFIACHLVRNAGSAILAAEATWELAGCYAAAVGRPDTLKLVAGALRSIWLPILQLESVVDGVGCGADPTTSPHVGVTFSLLAARYYAVRTGAPAIGARHCVVTAVLAAVSTVAPPLVWLGFTVRAWLDRLAPRSQIAVVTTHNDARRFAHFQAIDSAWALLVFRLAAAFIPLWRCGGAFPQTAGGRQLFATTFACNLGQCAFASNGVRTYFRGAFLPHCLAGICGWIPAARAGEL